MLTRLEVEMLERESGSNAFTTVSMFGLVLASAPVKTCAVVRYHFRDA